MKIAVVCCPLLKSPPDAYGGIERRTNWIARKLIEYGHDVHFFAKTGSYLEEPSTVYEYPYRDGEGESQQYAEFVHSFLKNIKPDIIHDCTQDKLLVKHYPEWTSITITTLPGLAKHGPNTTCISDSQRKVLGYSESVPVVHHGVPVEEYPPLDDPTRDYFLYMGSINDYKGVDIAIQICETAERNLYIAGTYGNSSYFDRFVLPRLGDKIQFLGEIGGETKTSYLQNARALLHPVRWQEPGAIIVIEALASGVPVIGSNNGCIPELINPAVGIICEVQDFNSYKHMTGGAFNEEQWLSALDRIDQISREDCAEYARQFLTDDIMSKGYSRQYTRILNDGGWE